MTPRGPGLERDAGELGANDLGAEIRHRLPALKALTSLRFFAAIYVAVYHLASGHGLVKLAAAENFVSSGDTGVSLFFILSGFILAYNYRAIDSLRDFWISRFARIYPVYLFALLLSLAYGFAPATQAPDHYSVRLVLTLGLLQSWYQPYADSFNGPGWTLSVEAFFYALFPLLLRGITRGRITRFGGWLFVAFCGAYLAFLSVPLTILAIEPSSPAAAPVASFLASSKLPLLHLPLFLIGAWLGATYAADATNRNPDIRSRAALYLGALGSLALLCAGPSGVCEPLRRGLLALCYAGLIYGLAQVRRGPLVNRWMVLAGEISFSIYILQMPVFRTVLGITRRLNVGPYASIVTALSVLIAVSWLAYRFIELPARVAIRGRLTHRTVPLVKI